MSEGSTLLHYLLKRTPSNRLVDRYNAGKNLYQGSNALILPTIVHRRPWLVRFLEAPLKPRSRNQKLLRQRLDMAMVLCETSAEGQRLLWRSTGQSRPAVVFSLLIELALDALALPFRLIVSLVWR